MVPRGPSGRQALPCSHPVQRADPFVCQDLKTSLPEGLLLSSRDVPALPRAWSAPSGHQVSARVCPRPLPHVLTGTPPPGSPPPASLAIQPPGDGCRDIGWGWGAVLGLAVPHCQPPFRALVAPLHNLSTGFSPRPEGRALRPAGCHCPLGPSTLSGRGPFRQTPLHCSDGTSPLPCWDGDWYWWGDRCVGVSGMSGTESGLCNCTWNEPGPWSWAFRSLCCGPWREGTLGLASVLRWFWFSRRSAPVDGLPVCTLTLSPAT